MKIKNIHDWWLNQGSTPPSPSEPTGEDILNEQSLFYYDFRNLTGNDADAISNGNIGLNDLGPSGYTLTTVGSPVVETTAVYDQTLKGFYHYRGAGFNIGQPLSTFFNNSKFHFFFLFNRKVSGLQSQYVLGAFNTTTSKGVSVYVNNGGQLRFEYGNSGSYLLIRTTSSAWDNVVPNGLSLFEVQVDFDADTITMYRNGEIQATTVNTGTIAGIDPSLSFSNTDNLYIGNNNNNGAAPTGNTFESNFIATALFSTPLTSDELTKVRGHFFSMMNWEYEINIASGSDITTKRADLISKVFNGSGLSALTPTIDIGVSPTNMHIARYSVINNGGRLSSVDKYTYVKQDVDGYNWTNIVYRMYNTSPNGKAILHVQGHLGSVLSATESAIKAMLDDGYDVLWCAPPISSADNITNNPTVAGSDVTGHNQILTGGLDRVGYYPLELFFFDKTSILSDVDGDYDDVYAFGHSGGGWTMYWLAAMDERITRTVMHRGGFPRTFRDNTEPDYEQGGTFYRSAKCGPRLYDLLGTHTHMDCYIMGTSNSRKFLQINHQNDDSVKGGTFFNNYGPVLSDLATSIGGTYEMKLFTNADSNNAHSIQTAELNYSMDFFNA